MYICKITGHVTKPGVGMNKLVIETRVKKYQNWDRGREEWFETFGSEIVKEVSVSDEGLAEWNVMSEAERESLKMRWSHAR